MKTASMSANGQDFGIKYRDSDRGFKLEISFVPDDDAKIDRSETGEYLTETWLSVNLPDDHDYVRERRELTVDVLETAVSNWAGRYKEANDHAVREITRVEVKQIREVRHIEPN